MARGFSQGRAEAWVHLRDFGVGVVVLAAQRECLDGQYPQVSAARIFAPRRLGWEIHHNPEAGVYRSDSGVDARRSAGAEGFGLEAEM